MRQRQLILVVLLFLSFLPLSRWTRVTPSSAAALPKADGCELVEKDIGPAGTLSLKAVKVASGLEIPWGLAFLPDRSILVTERPGRLRIIKNNTLVAAHILKIDTVSTGEGGLLGITLHPDFAKNSLFYLYYTVRKDGQNVNRVERFRLAADRKSASPDRIILDDIPWGRIHDGGRLRFGPDGMLYISTGDATQPQYSQDMSSPAGKLLRLTPDGEIPKDNPWPGKPFFLIGLRNSQAFDWINDKTLAVADHGPSGELGRTGHDEINITHAGDNLGWPTIWGCESRKGMVSPALTWENPVPPGGLVFHKGALFVGILGAKSLLRITLDPSNPAHVKSHEVYLRGDPPAGLGRIREVIKSPDGNIYLTTSNCDGRGECPAEKDSVLQLQLH